MEENKDDLFDTDILRGAYERHRSLRGFTTILNVIEFPKAPEFEDVNVLEPTSEEYALALELCVKLLQRGTPVPAVDIVIAALGIRRELRLRTNDPHFSTIRAVAPEMTLKTGGGLKSN